MKHDALLFLAAFLLGFLLLATRAQKTLVEYPYPEISDERRTSVGRLDDSFSEYESLMLSDEEKLQLALDKANTLHALLGLAEKLHAQNAHDENGRMMVADKLARLYPVEAIKHYAARPTNVAMNAEMEQKVIQSWAAHDLTTCLTFFDKDESRSINDFCELWLELAYQEWHEKSSEILKIFSQLSQQKQHKIIQNDSMKDHVLEKLLRGLSDPQYRSAMEAFLKDKQERQLNEPTQTVERVKSPEDLEREHSDEMIEKITKHNLPAEDIAAMLRDLKSRDIRMTALRSILRRRTDDGETADAWLARVSEVLDVVGEIPDLPPFHDGKGSDPSRKDFQAWLPSQSAKLQRAWADDVVGDMSLDNAWKWIENLEQASLRADLRDKVLASWAEGSPTHAAKFLMGNATSTEQEDYLPTAVYRWALRDYAAAKQWLENQADSPAKAAALKKLAPNQ